MKRRDRARGRGWGWGWAALVTILVGAAAVQGSEAPRYLGPAALAVSPDERTLFVACEDARQVLWVALPEGNIIRRVAVPERPSGLVPTPDGSQLIVTCAAPQSLIAVLDVRSGTIIQLLPGGHTVGGPVLEPLSGRLYVCHRFQDRVSAWDLPAGTQVGHFPAVREPVAAAAAPDGRTVLVANHLAATRTDPEFDGRVAAAVTIIDTARAETDSIMLPHGASSLRGICVTPDGRYALVTHLLSNFEQIPFRVDMGWINVNVISLVDVARRAVVATLGVDELHRGAGNPWGITCSPDGRLVCVVAAGTHELCVIPLADLLSDRARRTMSPLLGAWPIYPSLGASLWQRLPLPGLGPRHVVIAAGKAYVSLYFSDSIAVVDLDARDSAVVGSIPLGPPPVLSLERRGQLLFEDATLCHQHWQSCASCHPDGRTDALNWDLMNDGVGNPKNTKSMLLSHVTPPSMVTGVRETAEKAVRSGFVHILFAHRPEEESAAIDVYLSALEPVPSPYLVDGQLSDAARRGEAIFHSPEVACHRCHPAPYYTDMTIHSMGKPRSSRFDHRFDTPTLVEVWRTAPYLHDGRYLTLKEMLVEGRHGLSRDAELPLTDQELDDLVEFVLSL
jgi:DNA-binding beta-propeller fold protein YncE